jgi:hypothetical protein
MGVIGRRERASVLGGRSCPRGAILAIRPAGWGPWLHRGGWSGAAREWSRPQGIVTGTVGEWAALSRRLTEPMERFHLALAGLREDA